MTDIIRVLLTDAHLLSHTAVQTTLEKTNDLHLVASVTNINQIEESSRIYCPNIILLASNAVESSLLQSLDDLKQRCPKARVLFLLTIDDKVCISSLMKQGAAGCFSKQSPSTRLPEAIRAIADGNNWIDPILLNSIFSPDPTSTPLTKREKAVLEMLVAGKSDKEIALALTLTDRTIRRDIKRLCHKLGTNTRIQAAFKAGLLKLLG